MKRLLLILAALSLLGWGHGHLHRSVASAPARQTYASGTAWTGLTFARASAWTCPNAGGTALNDVAINVACTTAAGMRFSEAVTSYNRNGTMAGIDGGVPTNWTSVGGGVVSSTQAFHGAQSVYHVEDAAVTEVVFQNFGVVGSLNLVSVYTMSTTGGGGNSTLMYGAGAGNLCIANPATAWAWTRFDDSITPAVGAGSGSNQIGTRSDWCATPAVGSEIYYDSVQIEVSKQYPGPFCVGTISPHTCAAELAQIPSSTLGLSQHRGRVALDVTPLWAATESGIDRVAWSAAGHSVLSYLQASRTWSLTAGGQTVASAASAHAREATIEIEFTYRSGSLLSLTVDGVTTYSAGAATMGALPVNVGIGSTIAGADQIGGYMTGEVWTK